MLPTRRELLGGMLSMGAFAALPRTAWAFDRPFPALTALIDGYIAKKFFPGAVAAFGADPARPPSYVKAGTIAFDSATPADENTLWRCYSMTKPITGMTAMTLIEQGRMTLDTPVADFIPAFAKMTVMKSMDSLDAVPARAQITIRHLLTHTAGLGYTIVTTGPLLAEYNRLGITPASLSRTAVPDFPMAPAAPSLEIFANRLATLPLIAEPGTKWSYSLSLDLLGRVIEIAAGKPFDAVIQERIFDPLGMKDSFFQVPADHVARLSSNYFLIDGKPVPIDPGPTSVYLDKPAFPFGGAGLVASARDYDRFLAMLSNLGTLDGVQILKAETARIAMSNLLPAAVETKGIPLVDGQGYGAGGRVGISGPTKGVYGWAGAAGTVGWADAPRGIRGAGYAQFMPADTVAFQKEVGPATYRDLLSA